MKINYFSTDTWPSALSRTLILVIYILVQGFCFTFEGNPDNQISRALSVAIAITQFLIFPLFVFVLAKKGGYPSPYSWAILSAILYFAMPFVFIYLLVRTPYSKRVFYEKLIVENEETILKNQDTKPVNLDDLQKVNYKESSSKRIWYILLQYLNSLVKFVLKNRQKTILIVGIVAIILSFLFPCWQINSRLFGFQYINYQFIINPPTIDRLSDSVQIDYTRMFTQIIIILIAMILAILACRIEKDEK